MNDKLIYMSYNIIKCSSVAVTAMRIPCVGVYRGLVHR